MQPNKNIIIYIQLYWNIKVNVNSVKKKKKKKEAIVKKRNKKPLKKLKLCNFECYWEMLVLLHISNNILI